MGDGFRLFQGEAMITKSVYGVLVEGVPELITPLPQLKRLRRLGTDGLALCDCEEAHQTLTENPRTEGVLSQTPKPLLRM